MKQLDTADLKSAAARRTGWNPVGATTKHNSFRLVMALSKQQVFDKVALHLLKQNKRSEESANGACLYRGPNGTMCAVGCLIPDELYDSSTEETSAHYVITGDDRLQKLFEPDVTRNFFLGKLQSIHDIEPVDWWYFYLTEFAVKQGLSTDILTKP